MGSYLAMVDVGAGTILQLQLNGEHSCVIFSTFNLRCWGDNRNGQLGLGNINSVGDEANEMGTNLADTNLGSGVSVTNVALGNYHTVFFLNLVLLLLVSHFSFLVCHP